jgi:hypothetical protein
MATTDDLLKQILAAQLVQVALMQSMTTSLARMVRNINPRLDAHGSLSSAVDDVKGAAVYVAKL